MYTVAGLLVCIGAAQLTSTADDAGEKALEALPMRHVARPAPSFQGKRQHQSGHGHTAHSGPPRTRYEVIAMWRTLRLSGHIAKTARSATVKWMSS